MDRKTLFRIEMKKYLLFLFTLFGCSVGFAQSFEGTWQGSLTIQGMELPLVFNLKYDGGWTGNMQSPKQSNAKMPISKIKASADSIYITVDPIGLSYAGKLSADKSFIDGQIKQGGLNAPMKMVRQTASNAVKSIELVRTQTVNAPYPYDALNVNFENTVDKVTLSGTLTSPKEKGRYPAVILISGSGPSDRNSSFYGHEPFKVLADYLTRQGIVVLRYDDRGIGESTGDYKLATTGDLSKDALAGLKYLRKQANVDPKKVGIIGHSEGGLISLLLAGQRVAGLDFIVSLAGPALKIDSLMILQNEAVAKSVNQKVSQQEIQRIKRNYKIAKSDMSTEKAFAEIMANLKDIPGSQTPEFADQIGVLITPWYRYFLKIDPVPFIRKIKIPVYAAFGGKDIQVTAPENAESLTDNLPKNSKSVIKIYPEDNHLFQPAKTGAVAEYPEIPVNLDPTLLSDISNWIKKL